MSNKDDDFPWIEWLREQVDCHNNRGSSIWTDVEVTMCLGDARRLLYALDLVRGLAFKPDTQFARSSTTDEFVGMEIRLLANGTMEG